MSTSENAYFVRHADGHFVGNDPARGPWSPDHCHAGPVTGLVARAVEEVITDKVLTRITVDLLKPLPLAGLRVAAGIVREGRSVSRAQAEVYDLHGTLCATAASLHLAIGDVGPVPSVATPRLDRSEARASHFPVVQTRHDLPAFQKFIEVAYPPGQDHAPGPTTIWMKTPPLLAGEATSPFQHLCFLADCGNGISRNAEMTQMGFMNCDLTIVQHRPPRSEWLASEAVSYWESTGIAQARATIMDEDGPVATALQTVLLMPAGKGRAARGASLRDPRR